MVLSLPFIPLDVLEIHWQIHSFFDRTTYIDSITTAHQQRLTRAKMSDSDATVTDPNWSLYPYEPNRPAPIAFAVILTIIAVYQFYQSFSTHHPFQPRPPTKHY